MGRNVLGQKFLSWWIYYIFYICLISSFTKNINYNFCLYFVFKFYLTNFYLLINKFSVMCNTYSLCTAFVRYMESNICTSTQTYTDIHRHTDTQNIAAGIKNAPNRCILWKWILSVVKQSCLINDCTNKLFAVYNIIFSVFVSLKR